MARIRSIKPEIWMSPQVMNLSKDARLLFIGLITQADDEGRGTADPRRVKAAIFGGDDETSSNVRRMLDEIAGQRLIVLYHDDSHGDLYALPSWKQHQKIDRPGKSAYPPPSDQRALVEDSSSIRRGSEGSDRIGSSGSEGSYGSDAREDSASGPRAPEGNGETPAPHALTEAIKAVYPAGTYRGSNWILAERAISKLLDGGERADEILAHAHAFAAQQLAKGSTGTQFVLSPEKFFGPEGHWRGPFPLPVTCRPAGAALTWRPDPDEERRFAEPKLAPGAA